ncbi:MAG: lyase family protein, partial [Candidatus Binatia bacterium]
MIDRYSRSEMTRIWSEEARFQKWLEVEVLATEALARSGSVPRNVAARIKKKARIHVGRIREIEKEVRHEVIAFLRSLAESLGDDARFVHVGLTSSDIMDTGLALQLKEAASLLTKDIQDLMKVL